MAKLQRAVPLLFCCGLLGAGCSSNGAAGDGGGDGLITTQCPNGVGKSISIALAAPLALGSEATGYICPLRHSDFYRVEHTGSLLQVDLAASLADSPVKLTYLILDQSGVTKASAPAWTGTGARHFRDYHCLSAGTYYIQVKDEGNDAKDGQNKYTLKVGSAQDKDANEPSNDTQAGAKPPGTGYISCKGDQDWYTFSVGADQMVEVSLSTTKTTPLYLRYSIYDGTTKIAEESMDGSKAAINLAVQHCVPKAGTYTIVVDDKDNAHSDPDTPYALTVTPKAEQDAQDTGTRNDTPAKATACGSSCTFTGQIGCKGDIDYYKVDVSGVTKDNVGAIEITVDYGSAKSKIQPQAALLFADESTTCTKDACCRVLSKSCTNNDVDCSRLSYYCVHKDDSFCSDPDCNSSKTCTSEMACAGAVFCAPGGHCGGEQVSRSDANGMKVSTAQPLLHSGPFYVRVGDDKNDQYDYGRSYTVTIKAVVDPDGSKELNSEYFPNLPATNIDTSLYHRQAAKAKSAYTMTVGGTLNLDGHISYVGDQDWYRLIPPGAACGTNNECTLTVSYSTTGSCTNMKLAYGLYKNDGRDPWISFPAPSAPWPLSGNPGCVYVNSADDYYFVVWHYGHDAWSWDCQYHVSISTAAGCNSPCIMTSGKCDHP